MREFSFGQGVQKAREIIRKYVEFLEEDRPLYPDHTRMMELVKSCEILEEVEKVVGGLE
jgi:histidine ammonia-lyase